MVIGKDKLLALREKKSHSKSLGIEPKVLQWKTMM
jgi:hypothetical protein